MTTAYDIVKKLKQNQYLDDVDEAIIAASRETGLSVEDIRGKSQRADIKIIRRKIILKCHRKGLTFNHIGRKLNRSGSTISRIAYRYRDRVVRNESKQCCVPEPPERIHVRLIVIRAAQAFNISTERIRSREKSHELAAIRRFIITICRDLGCSWRDIAVALNRTHSTCMRIATRTGWYRMKGDGK